MSRSSVIGAAVCDVLLREYRPQRNGVKIVSRITDTPVETVRNWFKKRAFPDMDSTARLARHNDAVWAELMFHFGRAQVARAELLEEIELSKQQRTKHAGEPRNAGQGGVGA